MGNNPVVAERYLRMATSIATNVIYPRGLLKKGVGLCHGISGNAYTLLQLSKVLSEASDGGSDRTTAAASHMWQTRALQFAAFAVEFLDQLKDIPDRPFSLFEGIGGLACFLMDCHEMATLVGATDSQVAFPLYDLV
jgi:hypothetical protein